MPTLDDTDLEILELLMADARRPWSDIAEQVDLSPPAVADRVERLQEAGVVRRFTLDLDRSQLRSGVPILVRLQLATDGAEALREALRVDDTVEHVFTTAEGDLVCVSRVPDGDVPAWLDGVDEDGAQAIEDYTVTLLTDAEWTPSLGGTTFALSCAECGNTVTDEGETARLEGDLYHFCCGSCEARFVERFERMAEGAD
jgi:Lrp/AsnC family leucine-responsive transcriptional regulator